MHRGAAHSAGLYTYPAGSGTQVKDGADVIWATGLRSLKVYLTAAYKDDFPADGVKANYPLETWSATPATLTELAQTTEMATQFARGWDEIILTCFPMSTPQNAWWRPDPSVTKMGLEYAELYALAVHLGTTYPTQRFVFQQWEGDWAYVGRQGAGDVYALDDNGREVGVVSSLMTSRYAAFLGTRQRAIEDARAATGGQLFHAIEVNRVLDSRVYPHRRRMVRDLGRRLRPDLISYSAYDSTIVDQGGWCATLPAWQAATRPAYRRALELIDAAWPGVPIQIGEYGFPEREAENLSPPRDISEMIQLVDEESEAFGCVSCIYWQVFDNEASIPYTYRGYWLARDDGTQSTAGAKLQALATES